MQRLRARGLHFNAGEKVGASLAGSFHFNVRVREVGRFFNALGKGTGRPEHRRLHP